jgi:hypothetical protein
VAKVEYASNQRAMSSICIVSLPADSDCNVRRNIETSTYDAAKSRKPKLYIRPIDGNSNILQNVGKSSTRRSMKIGLLRCDGVYSGT